MIPVIVYIFAAIVWSSFTRSITFSAFVLCIFHVAFYWPYIQSHQDHYTSIVSHHRRAPDRPAESTAHDFRPSRHGRHIGSTHDTWTETARTSPVAESARTSRLEAETAQKDLVAEPLESSHVAEAAPSHALLDRNAEYSEDVSDDLAGMSDLHERLDIIVLAPDAAEAPQTIVKNDQMTATFFYIVFSIVGYVLSQTIRYPPMLDIIYLKQSLCYCIKVVFGIAVYHVAMLPMLFYNGDAEGILLTCAAFVTWSVVLYMILTIDTLRWQSVKSIRTFMVYLNVIVFATAALYILLGSVLPAERKHGLTGFIIVAVVDVALIFFIRMTLMRNRRMPTVGRLYSHDKYVAIVNRHWFGFAFGDCDQSVPMAIPGTTKQNGGGTHKAKDSTHSSAPLCLLPFLLIRKYLCCCCPANGHGRPSRANRMTTSDVENAWNGNDMSQHHVIDASPSYSNVTRHTKKDDDYDVQRKSVAVAPTMRRPASNVPVNMLHHRKNKPQTADDRPMPQDVRPKSLTTAGEPVLYSSMNRTADAPPSASRATEATSSILPPNQEEIDNLRKEILKERERAARYKMLVKKGRQKKQEDAGIHTPSVHNSAPSSAHNVRGDVPSSTLRQASPVPSLSLTLSSSQNHTGVPVTNGHFSGSSSGDGHYFQAQGTSDYAIIDK